MAPVILYGSHPVRTRRFLHFGDQKQTWVFGPALWQSAKSLKNRAFLDCTEPLCCIKVRGCLQRHSSALPQGTSERRRAVHVAQCSHCWRADVCAVLATAPAAAGPVVAGAGRRARTSHREVNATTRSIASANGAWLTTTTIPRKTGGRTSSARAAKASTIPTSGALYA